MKILHVVRQYAPAIGGLESYVRSMVRQQKALGHDCTVLTLNRVFHGTKEILPEQDVIDGVPVKRVGFIGHRRMFLPLVSPGYFKQFDVVHVHNTDFFFDYVALLTRILKLNAFATTHGGFFHTTDFSAFKKIYFATLTRFSADAYKAIFAISDNDFQTFKDTNKKVVLLPNAVEPIGDFTTAGDGFLYLGRLAKHKGVEKIITVFARLRRDHGVTGNLHIIGPAWDVSLEELSAVAAREGVTDYVILHGSVEPADFPNIARQCGTFLSASSYEGFGMSMIEAMSVGLIPFVQPNASFSELIGKAGIGACVDYDQADAASKTIASALPRVTQADREQARKFAAQYSWNELVAKTMPIYEGKS